MRDPLVSVIIPAFNAQDTIDSTVRSALSQTYPHLEILVVDDGSVDGTGDIVRSISEKYSQVQYIRQENSGVATARNTAIAAARGSYIAPLDADDLWHPERVARHVRALEEAGKDVAVAYSPFYVLDKDGVILGKSRAYQHSGQVFDVQIHNNIVGNGSGITVRKAAIDSVGGYGAWLQGLGAQGCEDYLLQMELAYRYKYICVPYYLIGYRRYEGNMSSNEIRMTKSRLHVLDSLQDKGMVTPRDLRKVKMYYLAKLMIHFVFKKSVFRVFRDGFLFVRTVQDFFILSWNIVYVLAYWVLSRLKRKCLKLLNPITDKSCPDFPHRGKRFEDIAGIPPELP